MSGRRQTLGLAAVLALLSCDKAPVNPVNDQVALGVAGVVEAISRGGDATLPEGIRVGQRVTGRIVYAPAAAEPVPLTQSGLASYVFPDADAARLQLNIRGHFWDLPIHDLQICNDCVAAADILGVMADTERGGIFPHLVADRGVITLNYVDDTAPLDFLQHSSLPRTPWEVNAHADARGTGSILTGSRSGHWELTFSLDSILPQ